MKYIGMIILVVSSTLMGVHFAEKSKNKVTVCSELLYLCDLLLIDYGYALTPTTILFEQLLNNESLSNLNFMNVDNIKFKQRINSCLSIEDNEKISDFLYSLGKSDVSGQIQLVTAFKDYVILVNTKYTQNYNKNHKLYVSFGFLVSVIVCLIFV